MVCTISSVHVFIQSWDMNKSNAQFRKGKKRRNFLWSESCCSFLLCLYKLTSPDFTFIVAVVVPSNRCPCASVIVLPTRTTVDDDDSSFCRRPARCIRDNGPACQPDLFPALPGDAIIFNIPDKRGRFGGLWLIMFTKYVRVFLGLTYPHCCCECVWANIKMTDGNNAAWWWLT